MASGLDQSLAKRLQEEHAAQRQLIQLVREHAARLPGTSDARLVEQFKTAFDRLHSHVARTISMKEQDGYLESILKVKPTLARQVSEARADHGQLLRLADSIRRDLSQIQPADRLLVRDACDRMQRFADYLSQHEQRENMLALVAFNTELGGD